MTSIQEALGRLFEGNDLDEAQMTAAMEELMGGEATPAQVGAFLGALRVKGETVEEVAAAARVMRRLASAVELGDVRAIDIVGTGGDASGTFNVSTCSAIVAAAAGVPVAKHGNRAVSSKSGAADLLEAAGVNIELDAADVARSVAEVGLGFMFAPRHHGAMRHAIGPRRELAARTVFNLLGPLTNPAGARRQVLGVYAREWVRPLAEVLAKLGSEHALVVHGADGMDEISVSGPTHVAELAGGEVREYEIRPGDVGLESSPPESIRVADAAESLATVRDVLDGRPGAARDIVLLNAGAAIRVGGAVESIEEGVGRAREAIDGGAARAKLEELVAFTATLGGKGGEGA